MHTLIDHVNLSEFTVSLAELTSARVKVLLDMPRWEQGRWFVRLVGPKMTLIGYMVQKLAVVPDTKTVSDNWGVSLEGGDILGFEFKELDFALLPFVTSLRLPDRDFPHSEEIMGLYAWAMRKGGMQLEIRADGTLALRAASRPDTARNVQKFKEDFRRLRDE